MDVMPDPLTELPLRAHIHEHSENIEIGKFYYIGIYDYTDDGAINDCEYMGHIGTATADEITIIVRWRRQVVEGNEQEWASIEPENLTIHWLDIDAPYERPCIRFYRRPLQS